MIDVIVSSDCSHCEQQKSIMTKSFFRDEYRIINVTSKEFDNLDVKDLVDAVPFIVVRDENGSVKYAKKGRLDGTSLHQIERLGSVPIESEHEKGFNLHAARACQLAGLNQYMDE